MRFLGVNLPCGPVGPASAQPAAGGTAFLPIGKAKMPLQKAPGGLPRFDYRPLRRRRGIMRLLGCGTHLRHCHLSGGPSPSGTPAPGTLWPLRQGCPCMVLGPGMGIAHPRSGQDHDRALRNRQLSGGGGQEGREGSLFLKILPGQIPLSQGWRW